MKTARRAFLPGCGPLWFGLELDAWDQAPCCLVLPEPSAPDGGFRSRLCGFAGAELSMGKRVLPGREPEPALLCVRALDWDGALTVPDTGLPNGFDILVSCEELACCNPGTLIRCPWSMQAALHFGESARLAIWSMTDSAV